MVRVVRSSPPRCESPRCAYFARLTDVRARLAFRSIISGLFGSGGVDARRRVMPFEPSRTCTSVQISANLRGAQRAAREVPARERNEPAEGSGAPARERSEPAEGGGGAVAKR